MTKKELGQHWLTNEDILSSIADAADCSESDTILEVGPGLGTLTDVLSARVRQVIAVEYDIDLLVDLQRKFSSQSNVTIVHSDIRKFDLTKIYGVYKVVANIPYYLTSNLIRLLSESSHPPETAVLLVQKEVAERICAEPGQMSLLSITAQFYFDCSLSIIVPSKYFTPPPKVDSQVVILKRRVERIVDVDEADFFRLAKAGYSERRKTLRNALSGGLHLPKEEIEELLEKAGISAGARAQELSLTDWYQIYRQLHDME